MPRRSHLIFIHGLVELAVRGPSICDVRSIRHPSYLTLSRFETNLVAWQVLVDYWLPYHGK